jgi:hypothetical protein
LGINITGSSALTNFTYAAAGNGGASQNAPVASAGGIVNAQTFVTTNVPGSLTVTANGNVPGSGHGTGTGGSITSGTGSGGAGGNSTTVAYGADATPGSGTTTSALSYGGNGGQGLGAGFSGGKGGNADAEAYSGTVTGSGFASAIAIGGNGGVGGNSAVTGNAGTASITASAGLADVFDSIAFGANPLTGGIAAGQVSWAPAGGAIVVVGLSGVNNGQGMVTGTASMATISGTGSLTIGTLTGGAGVLHMIHNAGGSSQSALIVGPNATFDLNNNHFFINYGSAADPIASIIAYIKSGYSGGLWTGQGIDSSAAATNNPVSSNPQYGIGYADFADAGNPAGLASGQIEIKYTLLGDANLDGAVNGADFAILASNFNKAVHGWDQGDFNYDGAANGTDFAALAANFNKGASQSADAALNSFASTNGLMADVPEPLSAGLMGLVSVGSLTRRRRRI